MVKQLRIIYTITTGYTSPPHKLYLFKYSHNRQIKIYLHMHFMKLYPPSLNIYPISLTPSSRLPISKQWNWTLSIGRFVGEHRYLLLFFSSSKITNWVFLFVGRLRGCVYIMSKRSILFRSNIQSFQMPCLTKEKYFQQFGNA